MKRFFGKYKLFLGLFFACFVIVGLAYLKVSLNKSKVISDNLEKKSTIEKSANKEDAIEKKDNSNYFVDIKGAVNFPGVYEMAKDTRVIDVVKSAGGLRDDANTSLINLSKKITDEMVIIIYTNLEVANAIIDKNNDALSNQYNCPSVKNEACNCPSEKSSKSTNSKKNSEKKTTDSEKKSSDKVNINIATKDELMTISGIGESKANAIISYREENGNFEKIDDIMNVSGIGQSLYDKIKENITT